MFLLIEIIIHIRLFGEAINLGGSFSYMVRNTMVKKIRRCETNLMIGGALSIGDLMILYAFIAFN